MWIACFELFQEGLQRLLLGWRARVAWMPIGVKSAFVADAEAVLVVVLAMSTDDGFRPSGLYASVTTHDIVIADALPSALAVPLVNLPCARCLAGSHGTAMDDQECDAAHKN